MKTRHALRQLQTLCLVLLAFIFQLSAQVSAEEITYCPTKNFYSSNPPVGDVCTINDSPGEFVIITATLSGAPGYVLVLVNGIPSGSNTKWIAAGQTYRWGFWATNHDVVTVSYDFDWYSPGASASRGHRRPVGLGGR